MHWINQHQLIVEELLSYFLIFSSQTDGFTTGRKHCFVLPYPDSKERMDRNLGART